MLNTDYLRKFKVQKHSEQEENVEELSEHVNWKLATFLIWDLVLYHILAALFVLLLQSLWNTVINLKIIWICYQSVINLFCLACVFKFPKQPTWHWLLHSPLLLFVLYWNILIICFSTYLSSCHFTNRWQIQPLKCQTCRRAGRTEALVCASRPCSLVRMGTYIIHGICHDMGKISY